MSTTHEVRPLGHPVHHDAQAAQQFLKESDASRREAEREANARRSTLYGVGRILVAMVFVGAGLMKAMNFDVTQETLRGAGMKDTGLLLAAAIGLEVSLGLALAVGYKVRAVAMALTLYLVLASLTMQQDFGAVANRIILGGNVSLIGVMLMLLGHGGGPLSLDAWLHHRETQTFGGSTGT